MSNWAITVMRKSGVDVIPGASIKSAKIEGDEIILDIEGNEEKTVKADHVVLAVGIDPNVEVVILYKDVAQILKSNLPNFFLVG